MSEFTLTGVEPQLVLLMSQRPNLSLNGDGIDAMAALRTKLKAFLEKEESPSEE